jgi:hypothetical protein
VSSRRPSAASGDTILLCASAQLGMASDQGGVDLNPQ